MRRGKPPIVALAVALLIAVGLALGAHPVIYFSEFTCPSGTTARPIGLRSGDVQCVPMESSKVGQTAPLVGSDRREVGLYLANIRTRVVDLDFIEGRFVGPAADVMAP